ncbi:hypothetical protein AYI69_g4595 [Smittium culicis]|uniref:Uncharacterized protein n=1 Tax=Smittium culicis TaxID=133412 RepID=A0A1R1YC99_9FUNG|nr:hypothetical protein AYI69_g4595 [Smittium culicis]
MDISQIIEYFREIGDNEKLDIKNLTNDAQTTTIDGTLKLVIVAPKEKRKGRPIIRPCEISCHADKLLCPVEA